MITGWEEFERFFSTVRPIDVRVYGKLSAEAKEWVADLAMVTLHMSVPLAVEISRKHQRVACFKVSTGVVATLAREELR
jgi:hypothetical protein